MPRKRASGDEPGNTKKDRPRFPPFRGPNYTMVPDEVFDVLLVELTGGELKTLLYIIRRTFGFKKETDQISLSQMLNGITTRDGRVLDRGVGLSKGSLLPALRSLEEMGLILTQRRQSVEKGHEPTSYSLNVSEAPHGLESRPPLVQKLHQGVGTETRPSPWSKNSTTQDTGVQETVEQETDIPFEHSNIRKVQPEGRGGAASSSPTREGPSGGFATAGDVLAKRAGAVLPAGSTAPVGGERAPVGKGRGSAPSRPRPQTETEEWQAISQYVADFMRLLGDQAPLKSSTTRAYNLFTASGLPLATFLNKMYEARARTQEATGNIEQEGADPTYGTKRKTKAAYFFAVLEDVLNLIDDQERARREAGTGTKRGRPKKNGGDTPSQSGQRQRDVDGPFGGFVEH